MKINHIRIQKAQELMIKNNFIGIMIMNQDDYRYFFDEPWIQPRAIIPAIGEPIFICFTSEEKGLRKKLGEEASVQIWSNVGEQMIDVKKMFQNIAFQPEIQEILNENKGKPKVGMQLFFNTPAFLVDMFKSINKEVSLVSSDPIMDELRMVKEEDEIKLLTKAQEIACLGMDRARELLKPGITGHEIATEALYTMMKAGAEGTSTPIHINIGIESCWIHGKTSNEKIQKGDFVVIDLTPQFKGYCANLSRTFIIGKSTEEQEKLIATYLDMKEQTRINLKPGMTPKNLDDIGIEVCKKNGLGEYHINGISHGIGLRFEETPASTIVSAHRIVKLKENMTVTIGHTVLANPDIGGVRFEDVYRVTPNGGDILCNYPVDNWLVE